MTTCTKPSRTAMLQAIHASVLKRAEYWRTAQSDSYNINAAVYVAMLEVANAINDVMASDTKKRP